MTPDQAEVLSDVPTTPARKPTILSRIVKSALLALYRLKGWRLEGRAPDVAKFVITGAPHTSNWDFIFFLGAAHELGLEPRFIGKHTLFKGTLKRFMFDMGGVPVDRTRRGGNFVDEVAAAFASADRFALVIAPEGSRGSSGEWRSGFYHIAMAAGVPVAPAWVDHKTKRGGMGAPIWPSGDYPADLATIAAFYREKCPDSERFRMLAAMAERLRTTEETPAG